MSSLGENCRAEPGCFNLPGPLLLVVAWLGLAAGALALLLEHGSPVSSRQLMLVEIAPETGRCATARLPWFLAGPPGAISPLATYENGRSLGFSNTTNHEFIRREGRGLHSAWGRTPYLSTSDNTNPAENGRWLLPASPFTWPNSWGDALTSLGWEGEGVFTISYPELFYQIFVTLGLIGAVLLFRSLHILRSRVNLGPVAHMLAGLLALGATAATVLSILPISNENYFIPDVAFPALTSAAGCIALFAALDARHSRIPPPCPTA